MKKSLLAKQIFFIDHIRKFQPVSRHLISDRFNMNRATTGNIIESLIRDGFVMEADMNLPSKERSAGRPPIGLKLNPAAGYFIGLDIYDQKLTAVLTDFECTPLLEHQAAFRKNARPQTLLKLAQETVGELLRRGECPPDKLLAVGISLPGIVNLKEGIAVNYHMLPNWNNIPFCPVLQNNLRKPVYAAHNSNTVALAEAWKTPSESAEVVAAILIRTGISLGIVRNREIIRAGTYSAGELGHTVINFNGLPCRCGRKGCLETYVSGTALTRILQETAQTHPDWPGAPGELEATAAADRICQLAEDGDPISRNILTVMFEHLCIGIDSVMSLYAPDIIAIDGIFNKAAPLLRETIEKNCLHFRLSETRIRIAPYDQSTAAVGAALLAASRSSNPVHYLLDQQA